MDTKQNVNGMDLSGWPGVGPEDKSHEMFDSGAVNVISQQIAYGRKFNLGNYESIEAECILWVRIMKPDNIAVDTHDITVRARAAVRENVRAQYIRQVGRDYKSVFLAPLPSPEGVRDYLGVKTAAFTLSMTVNLGDYNRVNVQVTDWTDMTPFYGDPVALHKAMGNVWESLWANLQDEVSRAKGNGGTAEDYFGVRPVSPSDLALNTSGQLLWPEDLLEE